MNKSEQEFVNEVFSSEELATMEGSEIVKEEAVAPVLGEDDKQAAPEPEATTQDAAPEQKQPQMVDVRAIQEARAAKRAAEEELAKFKAEYIRIDERLNLLNQAMAAPKADEVKPPTMDDDPLEYIKHEFTQTRAQLEEMKAAQARQLEAEQQQIQRQTIINNADSILAVSRTKHTDIDEAFNYATEAVKAEIVRRLQDQGITGQKFYETANQIFADTVFKYAAECPTDPDAAAEHIRRHARFWGWSPQQAPQLQAPQAAQPVAQQPTIQHRAEQQERHMSLSGVQGGQPPVQIDAKSLASMSDEQFKELMKTASGRKQISEVMGGV